MYHIKSRAFKAINLEQFDNINMPDCLGYYPILIPYEEQNILRMPIRVPWIEGFKIPKNLNWLKSMINYCNDNQVKIGIHHPFCYITVRSGLVKHRTTNEWHVDGFTMRTTHLPETNYFYVSAYPTELMLNPVKIPKDFDPLKHNLNKYFQSLKNVELITTLIPKNIYVVDPYVIHRAPPGIIRTKRTFIRISFVPTEIIDDNFTKNPLIEMRHYGRQAVKDFRDKLVEYL